MGFMPGKSEIKDKSMILKPGNFVNRDTIVEKLIKIGYRRVPIVAGIGS